MSAIFISHSSKDKEFCERLKAWLADLGHRSVFLDFDGADGIEAGSRWEQQLYRELRQCRAVIAVCTGHFVESRWCFAETTQARALGKPVFPIKVGACDVTSILSDTQIVDFIALGEDQGYAQLQRGLAAAGVDSADPFDWDGGRPPYPGLLAFQEEDAAIFFGRDAEIGEGLDQLNRLHRFGGSGLVMVLGASGSGKSSLVRAGIIPRLRKDLARWLVLDPIRPENNPVGKLTRSLAKACTHYGVTVDDVDALRERLLGPDGAAELVRVTQDVRLVAERDDASVVLVIDQFEELLGQTDDVGATFQTFLRAILDHRDSRMVVIGTMRSDFLAVFQETPAFTDIEPTRLFVNRMGAAALTDVITKPAELAGVTVEPTLVQTLIDDTKTQDALPLLAFTLRELYDRYADDNLLEVREYRDLLGGLHGALSQAADGVLQHPPLSEAEEAELRRTILKMVRLNEEGNYARRVAWWDDMSDEVQDVLRRLVDRRLLVTRTDEQGRSTVEVAHEALFRAWDRLAAWLSEDRDFLQWRNRLGRGVREWELADRDESTVLRGPVLVEAEERLTRAAGTT